MTRKFDGFSRRAGRATPLPGAFFNDLLPLIDDLAELKVTLFCFWALYQKEGKYRYLRRADFSADRALMDGLTTAVPDQPAEQTLDAALEHACTRESLLRVEVDLAQGKETLYFVNTSLGREAVAQIEAGAWQPGGDAAPIEILPERPTIYRLYEDNIGPLTPMIADSLKDAEQSFGSPWVEDAIRAAVENNARSWRYIRAVLEGWEKEGKTHGAAQKRAQQDGRWYVSGEYADFYDH